MNYDNLSTRTTTSITNNAHVMPTEKTADNQFKHDHRVDKARDPRHHEQNSHLHNHPNNHQHHGVPVLSSREIHQPVLPLNDRQHDHPLLANTNNSCVRPQKSAPLSVEPRLFRPVSSQVDGWYAWVVVLSSFVISAVADGIGFSVGIFFGAFQAEFGSNKHQTSYVSSVLNGVCLLIGPVVSVFINLYDFRRVAVAGCLLAALAFSLSTLSPTIEIMVTSYGFFGGVGLGLLYQPAVIIVGYYFYKRRALAIGIMCCGSGLGAVTLAPLLSWVVEKYNWKIATYLTAALVLLCVCACATFKPLDEPKRDSVADRKDSDYRRLSRRSSFQMNVFVHASESSRHMMESVMLMAQQLDQCEDDEKDEDENNATYISPSISSQTLGSDKTGQTKVSSEERLPQAEDARRKGLLKDKNVNRKSDSFFVSKLPESAHKLSINFGVRSETPEHHEERKPSIVVRTSSIYRHFLRLVWLPVKKNLVLLTQVSFLLYGTACFLMSIGMYVPVTFLPILAREVNQEASTAALLISVIGFGNIISRLFVGIITDRYSGSILPINCAALVMSGLATCVQPLLVQYPLAMIANVFVYGACIGAFVTLQVVILIDLLGLSKLTIAFGLISMYHGIGTLVGPPLAGYIWDFYGDVYYAFYVIGGIVTLSGIICFPLHVISAWENRQANKVCSEMPKALKQRDAAFSKSFKSIKIAAVPVK